MLAHRNAQELVIAAGISLHGSGEAVIQVLQGDGSVSDGRSAGINHGSQDRSRRFSAQALRGKESYCDQSKTEDIPQQLAHMHLECNLFWSNRVFRHDPRVPHKLLTSRWTVKMKTTFTW